jgi:hypothetical protein
MRLGFSSLYLIALGLYGLAWLTMQPGLLSLRQFQGTSPEAQDDAAASGAAHRI